MSAAATPDDEDLRLKVLQNMEILDTAPEVAFDDLTQMAARICGMPIALLSLVDRERQWFKSRVGLDATETPRASAFCAHAILGRDPLVVPDARKDERFSDNPLVLGDPNIRFYAGVPLVTSGGQALGTLCVIDRVPRALEPDQLQALHVLSRFVITELELRRLTRTLEERVTERTTALKETAEALQRNKESLDLALEAAGVGLWEGDPATGRTTINKNLARMFGLNEGVTEVGPEALHSAIHPRDRERVLEALRRTMKGESDFETEHRIVRPDGAERWTIARGRAQFNKEGRAVRMSGAQFDITPHKEAEQAQRRELKAQAELVTVLERVGASVLAMDRHWNVVYVNSTAAQLLGRKADELVGKNLWSQFPQPGGVELRNDWQAALDSQKSQTLEHYYPWWDRWLESRLYPAMDGISVYFHDITERKAGEAAVTDSERRFRLLFEHAIDGILIWDRRGRHLDANRTACTLLGYSRDELLQKSAADLVVPAEVPKIEPAVEQLVSGEAVRSEWQVQRKDGSTFQCEVVAWQLPDDRLQAFIRDVTEKSRARAELQRSATRMRELARRLADAQELEQRRISVELHDRIGQNLTALGLNLSMMAGSAPDVTATTRDARLKDSQELVEGTMASVRNLIAELRPTVLDEFGLLPALRWVANQHQKRTGVVVSVEGREPKTRPPPAVEFALFRIAQEALTNIAKHASAKKVVLTVETNHRGVTMSIADDGVGFDPTELESAGAGAHWGLEMIRERAAAVGAVLNVDSAPGKGTTVRIEYRRPR